MSCKSLRGFVLLAAGVFAAGCQEGSLTASAETDLTLQSAMAEAEVSAMLSGEVERAEALRRGAEAIRWGIRPSRIEVKIHNETYSYLALVIGTVRRSGEDERLIRSLVAWTGQPTRALLQVTSATELALFGFPNGGQGDGGPGMARGHWKDFANHALWAATAGSAELELNSTGHACPQQPADATRQCVTASFDVRVNGSFQLVGIGGPSGPPTEIKTDADGVHGVVIKPAQ